MNETDILGILERAGNAESLEGMGRYGISTRRAFGVGLPFLRQLARRIGKDHALAGRLWAAGYRETRLLATLIEDPKVVDPAQAQAWVADVDSWDVCDGLCNNLLRRIEGAYDLASAWTRREETFVKRAGFVVIAALAVHDKTAGDDRFEAFLTIVQRESGDERNYVRKAVNWSLRQIGKRSGSLNRRAVALAKKLALSDSRSARWIGTDALRELTAERTLARIRR